MKKGEYWKEVESTVNRRFSKFKKFFIKSWTNCHHQNNTKQIKNKDHCLPEMKILLKNENQLKLKALTKDTPLLEYSEVYLYNLVLDYEKVYTNRIVFQLHKSLI